MDEKGCIPLEWPSKRIPQGGIFHNHKVTYTPETQKLMKVLMEESKLTLMQRKQVDWCLRSGSSLSEFKHDAPRSRRAVSTVHTIRPRTSRRRSYSAIIGSGDFERERYRPNQCNEDRETVKHRLQEIMEFGRHLDVSGYKNSSNDNNVKLLKKQLPGKRDLMHNLLSQIKERSEWLDDMEALGEGAKHRDAIYHQIAERFRKLEALHISDDDITVQTPHAETHNISAEVESFNEYEDTTKRNPEDKSSSHSPPSNRAIEADVGKRGESLRQEAVGSDHLFDTNAHVNRISQRDLSINSSPNSVHSKYSRKSDKRPRTERISNEARTGSSASNNIRMGNKSQKKVEDIAEISLTCTSCLSTERSERKNKKPVKL